MKLFAQSATLLLACFLVLIISATPLSSYMTPILGLLIIVSVIAIVLKQRSVKRKAAKEGIPPEDLFVGSNKEVFMVTITLLLAVLLTGGLSSSLYFLLYFLVFGLVFLFEPETVFVLLLGILVVFAQFLGEGDLVSSLVKLGSLVFLSPISYFFGREFKKREKLEQEIMDKTGQIIEDARALRERTQDEEAKDEIDDIVKESEKLREQTEE